jgi:hypothetical protein
VVFWTVFLAAAHALELKSPAFSYGGPIPPKYTCDGSDVSPPLQIQGLPGGTRSLALIVDDPDAPRGTWVHWVVWNIPPGATRIKEGRLPQGAVEGVNDFGRRGWGGPCPPYGLHRYFFKLYALDTVLQLPQRANKAQLLKAMKGHVLAEAVLLGRYRRP